MFRRRSNEPSQRMIDALDAMAAERDAEFAASHHPAEVQALRDDMAAAEMGLTVEQYYEQHPDRKGPMQPYQTMDEIKSLVQGLAFALTVPDAKGDHLAEVVSILGWVVDRLEYVESRLGPRSDI